MPATVSELNVAEFENATAQGLTLVDFWAPWCMPCVMQGPIIEQVAQRDWGGAVRVAKVNVDEHPALAERFSIEGIPTLLLLRDGEVVQRFLGAQSEETLVNAIEYFQQSNSPPARSTK